MTDRFYHAKFKILRNSAQIIIYIMTYLRANSNLDHKNTIPSLKAYNNFFKKGAKICWIPYMKPKNLTGQFLKVAVMG